MLFTNLSVTERRTLPPAIAVSTVAFAVTPPEEALVGSAVSAELTPASRVPAKGAAGAATTLWIPLVRRTREPFRGLWALPGGPTQWDETLTDTATRTIHDAVHRPPAYLEQLYSFGAVERSADAQRLVTIAYWAQYGERDIDAAPSRPQPASSPSAYLASEAGASVGSTHVPPRPRRWDDVEPAATRAVEADEETKEAAAVRAPTDANVAWFSADELPPLAFDHDEIVRVALERLRTKTEYSSVAHRFLGPEFTLTQLRRVHEAVLGATVDPANFRRQVLATGTLIDTGEFETGTAHRPARLYRFADSGNSSRAGAGSPRGAEPHNITTSPQVQASLDSTGSITSQRSSR